MAQACAGNKHENPAFVRRRHWGHHFPCVSDLGFDSNPNASSGPGEPTRDTQSMYASNPLWHLAAWEGRGEASFGWACIQRSPGRSVGPDWPAPGCPSLLLFCPLPQHSFSLVTDNSPSPLVSCQPMVAFCQGPFGLGLL